MKQSIILINPWVYDFAAYDLWAKPLGLLYLTSQLKASGFKVHLIDCLDVHNPHMQNIPSITKPVRRKYGTGKFWKQAVPKPFQLSSIPRTYSRYGITPKVFIQELKKVNQPAAILVTSLMTYWYPGVFEAINLAKTIHPSVPVILGGIYATLCPEHAKAYSHADLIISAPGQFWPLELSRFLKKNIPDFYDEEKVEPFSPYPAFDLLTNRDYICLLSSLGCPFGCAYCASHYLNPQFMKRDPLALFEEISYWHTRHHIQNFAFYDDALLVDAKRHIGIFLEKIVSNNLDLNFHCPNGLHITYLDKTTADLLYRAGFKTIRLGLETSDKTLHKHLGEKYSISEFEQAVTHLKKAGFTTPQIGAYILIGLPGQTYEQVAETITYVEKVGATPYLSEYSPIPFTQMWKEAVEASRFDLASEPLFHNNTIFPCWNKESLEKVPTLKNMVKNIRKNAR